MVGIKGTGNSRKIPRYAQDTVLALIALGLCDKKRIFFFLMILEGCAVRSGFRGSATERRETEPVQTVVASPPPVIREHEKVVLPPETRGEVESFTLPDLQIIDKKTCSQTLNYTSIPPQPFSGDNGGSAKYQDVMVHYDPFHDSYGSGRHFAKGITGAEFFVVSAHETVHFTANGKYQRTVFEKPTEGHQFIYLGDGKGVKLARSKTVKGDLVSLVNATVKTLLSAKKATDSPLGIPDTSYLTYIAEKVNSPHSSIKAAGQLFEEWAAYLNDYEVALELIASKKYSDSPSGKNLSFVYLGFVAALGISLKDPIYFEKTDVTTYYQLKPLVACMTEKAMNLHRTAQMLAPSFIKLEEKMLSELRTGSESEILRSFIRKWQGPSWTQSVLGF